ncbi:TIGR01777 family oxidoreductase [Labilibaculum sp.]|uniref:TIGR01777 family oxidoreductase n=1 Tax=Labilibaculum sp. TaxID=2060723 RepID=UPI00356B59A8
MKIGISGVSGLVGSHLRQMLKREQNANILSIPRKLLFGKPENLADFIQNCEIIIHLSGAPIICRWNKKNKKILRDSRILSTENLSAAIGLLKIKPNLFISTSAVGIYDTENIHEESSVNFANDFLGKLCQDWEKAALETETHGVRTVIFRLGVVLSDKGGALAKALPLFKLALGGKLGNGNQPFPFVHINDLQKAYLHAITNENSHGVYNLVAPDLITNANYTKELSACLNRPAFFHVPAFVLKLIFGEGAIVLLSGQKVMPERLIDEGFVFDSQNIKSTIYSLLRSS